MKASDSVFSYINSTPSDKIDLKMKTTLKPLVIKEIFLKKRLGTHSAGELLIFKLF